MAQTIRFPSLHVAQSTANRILNVADGLPGPAPAAIQTPVLPDTQAEGDVLAAQIATPPVPVEMPPGSDGAVVQAALGGADLSQAIVAPVDPGAVPLL